MEKLTPEKARWLAERYYRGMEKRDPSMAREFYTEDFVLQDDGAVDLVRGIKEAEAFLQNMYNTWPDLRFQLLKEPCIGIDGVTVAFLVRATSSRKSRRKFTGPTAQWEFASFYTVDLEQEKFCAGRCCFNMLDVYEMLLPIPKRGGKFFRKLEKMFTGRLAKKKKITGKRIIITVQCKVNHLLKKVCLTEALVVYHRKFQPEMTISLQHTPIRVDANADFSLLLQEIEHH